MGGAQTTQTGGRDRLVARAGRRLFNAVAGRPAQN